MSGKQAQSSYISAIAKERGLTYEQAQEFIKKCRTDPRYVDLQDATWKNKYEYSKWKRTTISLPNNNEKTTT